MQQVCSSRDSQRIYFIFRLQMRGKCELISIWLLFLLSGGQGITVQPETRVTTERAAHPTPPERTEATTVYLNAAAPRDGSQNRVPTHEQFVRPVGYVYDDADDVIHIIEPPRHFENLKKRHMQHRGGSVVPIKELPPKVLLRGALRTATRAGQSSPTEESGKRAAKVSTKVAGQTGLANRKPVDIDLLMQEAQHHLPLAVLASVRKTERLWQQQTARQPPARQRLKTKKVHTVIMEKAYEQQQFERGQERRMFGSHQPSRRRNGGKRVRRESSRSAAPLGGEELLLQLNELLENSTNDDDLWREISPNATNLFDRSDNVVLTTIENGINLSDAGVRQWQQWSPVLSLDGLQAEEGHRFDRIQGEPQLSHDNDSRGPQPNTNETQPTDPTADAFLLYDDVMATIRKMLQTRKVQLLEETKTNSAGTGVEEDVDGSLDLKELSHYLKTLQTIAEHILHPRQGPLNTRRVRPNSTPSGGGAEEPVRTNWFFINRSGGIYRTHLHDKDLPAPPTAIFRKFPDIPNASRYLGRRTVSTPAPTAVVETV